MRRRLRGKNKLANAILEGIIKRAQAGELDAVNWLEERGLLKLQSREVSKASKAAIESGVSQEELREAEELQQAIAKKIMENSVKFSKAQHESESLKVKGFSGLHFVEVAGEGKNPETKKPYSYGVDTDGERDGSCRIVLVNVAKTKTQLTARMSALVDYSVAKGNSEEDAISEVIKNVNHARNINQRQPFRPSASNATGVREVSKAAKAAIDSEVPKESLEEAIARLTDEANNARMAS